MYIAISFAHCVRSLVESNDNTWEGEGRGGEGRGGEGRGGEGRGGEGRGGEGRGGEGRGGKERVCNSHRPCTDGKMLVAGH